MSDWYNNLLRGDKTKSSEEDMSYCGIVEQPSPFVYGSTFKNPEEVPEKFGDPPCEDIQNFEGLTKVDSIHDVKKHHRPYVLIHPVTNAVYVTDSYLDWRRAVKELAEDYCDSITAFRIQRTVNVKVTTKVRVH